MRIPGICFVAAMLCLAFASIVGAEERAVQGVVTTATGHPRQYVIIAPDYDHIDWDRVTITDAEGKFVIKGAPTTQRHWLALPSAEAPGGFFTLAPDATTARVKLVQDRLNVEARVITPDGIGVKGATVNFYARMGEEEFFLGSDQTDDGGYVDGWLMGGDGVSLIARVMKADQALAASESMALRTRQQFAELPAITVPSGAVGQSGKTETRRRIGGVVRDEDGKPIAGVKVNVEWSKGERSVGRVLARTDADGKWGRRVPVSVDAIKLELIADHHISSIFDRGYPSPPMASLIDGSAVSVLKRGNLLRGVVRDEAGKPVDDALVLAATTGANGGTLQPDEDVAVRTVADGSFQLDGIPSGKRELVVYGKDLAPAVVMINPGPDSPALNVTLQEGVDQAGVVVDSTGKPLADAEISIYHWTTPTGESHFVPRNPKSDANGHFALAHLPPGTFQIRAWKKGYNSTSRYDVRVQNEPLRVELQKPAKLAGTVIDDATGKPITRYKLYSGWKNPEHGPMFLTGRDWEINAPNGAFSVGVDWTGRVDQDVRVVADGYLVHDTMINATDAAAPAILRLTRADPYIAVVTDTDGKPVTGASVAWVRDRLHAYVRDGKLQDDYSYSADIVTSSNDDGSFRLPKTQQQGVIFITSPPGYAQLDTLGFQNGQSIKLTPWATIKGSIRGSGSSVARRYIRVHPSGLPMRNDEPVQWQLNCTTADDGSFTIAHVPAMPLHICRGEIGVFSHDQLLDPKPGQTLTVEFGVGGQTVRGHLISPADLVTDNFNNAYGLGKHYTGVYARRAGAPLPEPPNDDYGYAASLDPDGQFVIEGVPPGKYELVARTHAPPMPQSCGITVALASAKATFEITDQPVELGSIALVARPIPTAGRQAPDLAGKTLDDKSASLADLKGRIVLLDFWASWCAPCKGAAPIVKRVWDKHAAGGKLAILGVNLDYRLEDAKSYAKEGQLPWPSLCFTGWGESNPALQAYGVSSIPSFWLIDQSGKVLARDIPPGELEAAVEKALR